ncbi:MAG: DUF1207 domain-containing protein [Endomicrobiaceae bacterium]|nr:DUF1207 domain-containing protein [Endomicrobiaceae bacterium]
MLVLPTYSAVTENKLSDQFLSGYITSVIERDWRWRPDSYKLQVSSGIATISLIKDNAVRREVAETQLRKINGIKDVEIVIVQADDTMPAPAGNFLGITGLSVGEAFPIGDLFRPLLADPKQPQFFVSMYQFNSANVRYIQASVGFGETFGLYRFLGINEGDGIQFNLEGGLFAQFNMSTASHDLINADYTIGIPVTYRYGDNSIRLRIYHQSSHLGDELLLNGDSPDRVNLSFEAVEFLYSREWHNLRVYGGGEYMLKKEPNELKQRAIHWGIEYRGTKPLIWNGRLVSGADMKAFEEHNWGTDISIKTGLEFGQPNLGKRRLRVMIEWYGGFNPRGQFYIDKVEYYGLGVSLGF